MGEHFFQKTGHELLRGNMVFARLPLDVKGLFWDMRLMADDQTWEDGTFPLGSAKRARVDDIVALYSDGTKARGNYVLKSIERLKAAGVVAVTPSGVVKLSTFVEEQALGNPDANRKRAKAEGELQELVNGAGTALRVLFRRSGARALPFEVLVDHLRSEFGCYRRKAEEILGRMVHGGVLACRAEDGLYGLASLAPPAGAGAGNGVAGADFFGARKIPLEPEPEPEKGGIASPQLTAGQLGASPDGRFRPPGSRSPGAGSGGASEARGLPAGGMVGDGPRPPGAYPQDSPDWMIEPGDAYRVPDPVHAAVLFLEQRPGWRRGSGSGPEEVDSRRVLLARWTRLRDRHGPEGAEALWRNCLRDIVEDGYDKSWRTFTGVFVSRLDKASGMPPK